MPRKPKDIYSKIEAKTKQINQTKEKLLLYENELTQLNKERESMEMREIFKTAKEHNLSCKQVIEMISKVHIK